MAPIPAFRFDIAFQTVFFLKMTYKTNYKNQRRRKNTTNTGLPGCPVHGAVPVTPLFVPIIIGKARLRAREAGSYLYAPLNRPHHGASGTGATYCEQY